tara:strand:- start:13835 stop:14245 length:411 start_codon:yes stop_codon:yes gene_type:complete
MTALRVGLCVNPVGAKIQGRRVQRGVVLRMKIAKPQVDRGSVRLVAVVDVLSLKWTLQRHIECDWFVVFFRENLCLVRGRWYYHEVQEVFLLPLCHEMSCSLRRVERFCDLYGEAAEVSKGLSFAQRAVQPHNKGF